MKFARFTAQSERNNGVKMAQTLKALRGKRLNGSVSVSVIAIVTVVIAGLIIFNNIIIIVLFL